MVVSQYFSENTKQRKAQGDVADSTFPATRFKVYKTTLGLSIHNYLIPILTFGCLET
jgi:hypothetical protein